ncbi:MAG TPA: discoidin domain-containing protein [Micromonosporaceae bacterium]|nr:discoidin domain-containing protein [Micromonosporaceae bacterium]
MTGRTAPARTTGAPGHRRLLAVATAAVATAAAGVLGAAAPARAIVGGTAAADGAYSFVAKIDTDERACSGALVHASWVLTAKSCFGADPAAGPAPAGAVATVGRTDLGQNTGARLAVTELSPHPTLDVVLAKLAEPVSGVTPVALGGAPVAGEVLRAAGYGRTATEWVPNRLHTAAVTAGGVTDAAFTIAGTGDGATVTCLGDAGGPTVRESGGQVTLVGLHSGSRGSGCLTATATQPGATEIRADRLDGWIQQHVAVPTPVADMSPNLARGAAVATSTSAENWGWNRVDATDGDRTNPGWTSWPPNNAVHNEWIELTFPQARQLNRVDLFPRVDQPVAENNFPTNFIVQVWDGAWETVVTRNNVARPSAGVQVTFPLRTASKIRVQSNVTNLMQLNEIEAYRWTNLAVDATVTASTSAEQWGWNLVDINDGDRTNPGWTSWPPNTAAHTEWVEFTFPQARQLSRVDLYPRIDQPVAQNNFPANFTIEVWNGTAWQVVNSKTNFPKPSGGKRFWFPTQTTTKFRVNASVTDVMQLVEVEAYASPNMATDAVVTASSSAEQWGWLLTDVNDGVRDEPGWTSWPPAEAAHTEWLEFTFPAARQVNRVDLYPRIDQPVAENNFPANFTVDVWDGSAWQTVVTKTGAPRSNDPLRVTFPTRSTQKVRIQGSNPNLVQFNEVEIYAVRPGTYPAPTGEALASIVEQRDYPDAARILAERGITLHKGDGHILLVDCGPDGTPPADMLVIETYDLDLPGGPKVCFRASGSAGWLTMEISKAFLVRSDATRTVAATVETQDNPTVIDVERVDPGEWQAVGVGQSRGDAKILELRYPFTE